ncbi:MAG: hypothetical protein ACREUQ_08665, partial [Burkholderiales bacterium]
MDIAPPKKSNSNYRCATLGFFSIRRNDCLETHAALTSRFPPTRAVIFLQLGSSQLFCLAARTSALVSLLPRHVYAATPLGG